jgi:Na+-transporting NADH:ubiquinone oxidoreductase subunit B
MKLLRNMLDRIEPHFRKGGRLEKLYPLYEANDTLIYSPAHVTRGSTHIRDALDTKRMMTIVIVALIPCVFMALYNTGYQANKIIGQAATSDGQFVESLKEGSSWWRYGIMDAMGVSYTVAGDFYENLTGLDLGRILACMVHGALYFLPMYVITLIVGGLCEVLFSVVRKHEINEGFLVTSMLYPLTLPPDTPLWQVAIGIAFGVIVAKEIFGGTGTNFLNVALTARAFLYFSYAPQLSGDKVWTTVDGYSGATALGAIAADEQGSRVSDIVAGLSGTAGGGPVEAGNMAWWDAFWGNIHGSIGETSAFCCLLGAIILIATRVGSWKIMAGVVLGMAALSGFFCLLPIDSAAYGITPQWHLVLGGFAFGTVFMATDPVSASMTEAGKWIYGILIGVVTVMVRTMNIGFPEGIMLAILFGNCFAPLIDYFVVEANIKRRLARYAQ